MYTKAAKHYIYYNQFTQILNSPEFFQEPEFWQLKRGLRCHGEKSLSQKYILVTSMHIPIVPRAFVKGTY